MLWFWVNGSYTKEGITADLEAMKRAGVGGVLIMEVATLIPGPVKTLTPEWWDLLNYAFSEAGRLGLEIDMNNDLGWSGSGGPWIQPEDSMKMLVWTETRLHGPGKTEEILKQPLVISNYYRDVAVIAFPAPAGETEKDMAALSRVSSSFPDVDCGVLKTEAKYLVITPPDPAKNDWYLQFEYDEPFTARSFSVEFGKWSKVPMSGAIQYSVDGQNFTQITPLEFNFKDVRDAPSYTVNFAPVSARFFRVSFAGSFRPAKNIIIQDASLRGAMRVDNGEFKAGYKTVWGHEGGVRFITNSCYGNTAQFRGAVSRDKMIDLTSCLDVSGKISWDAPEGEWVVLRIGQTTTGHLNNPAPIGGSGLECDKLSRRGVAAHWPHFMGKILRDSKKFNHTTLRCTHIDSWEESAQNWTESLPEEFKKRQGYDLKLFLPAIAGYRIVDSPETTERFLWDFRRTISDLVAENYYGAMRDIAHQNGLLLEIEATGANQFLYDSVNYQKRADIPMGEFWYPNQVRADCKIAASAAHLNGTQIVAGEAFTAMVSRWVEHPYALKALGDFAFTVGINRFVIHRFAQQPWTNRAPGITMGPYGINCDRTATWWEEGKAWFSYLARSQHLLRQGHFAADVLWLTQEGTPNAFYASLTDHPNKALTPVLPSGYDYDGCDTELLASATVENGLIVFPSGMRYRVLLLPNVEEMSLARARILEGLVAKGALIMGPKPKRTVGLSGYPQNEAGLSAVADKLWGESGDVIDRQVGKGRVVQGKSFEEIFSSIGLPPDFSCQSVSGDHDVNYIHRIVGDADIYFVANHRENPVDTICSFRAANCDVELWDAVSGNIVKTAVHTESNGVTRVPLHFDEAGSVFVVLRPAPSHESVKSVARNGRALLNTEPFPGAEKKPEDAVKSFSVLFTVTADKPIDIPAEADTGVVGCRVNHVISPLQGQVTWGGENDAGMGVAVGNNGIVVLEHGARYYAPTLAYKTEIGAPTHVAIVYNQNRPSLYINGQLVRTGLQSKKTVHSSLNEKFSQTGSGFSGTVADVAVIPQALSADDIAARAAEVSDAHSLAKPVVSVADNSNRTTLVCNSAGTYEITYSSGRKSTVDIPLVPAPIPVEGSWKVRFPEGWHAPAEVVFDELISWPKHSDPGVKYFSGTAAYLKTVQIPSSLIAANQRLYIDLGNVQVIAHVFLNGKDIGIAWKPPYRLDITEAVRAGKNELEVRVVNTWVNRLIGDEQYPDDCSWNSNGSIKEWPQWLIDNTRRPGERVAFTTWKHWKKTDPLLPSGLIGPVRIVSEKVTVIN
jgi:hypothetical protein